MADSVAEQTPFREHVANGVTTVFAYDFQVLAADDLVVYLDGVAVAASEYTVSGIGVQAGGSVTFDVAPANGALVLLSREIALERTTEYQTLGDFKAAVVNQDFNRLWMALQGFSSRIFGGIRAPYPVQLNELPGDPADFQGHYIGIDGAGQPTYLLAPTGTAGALAGQLADTAGAGNGTGLLGWLRALTSSVATTLKSWLGWQEINAFEFMTVAQIASFQASDGALDHATPLQAWINACAASAASGGKIVGRLPAGGGRVGTTLTVPGSVVLRGQGVNSLLKGWGVGVFQITGDHVVIEDMGLFGYTNAGVPDPKTQDAITSNGVLATKNNYARLKRLYLQGWNRCIDLHYMDGSVIDDVTTVNANYGVRYFGQSVNNTLINSRLVVNSGVASVHCQKNGSDQGEGLMVTNTLLASGQNAFLSDGFLSVGFYNCIADLLTEHAFDMNSVIGFAFDGPWIWSAKRCINFQALGGSLNVDATIKVGLATTTGAAQNCLVVGANNNGVSIAGGTYVISNGGGGLPFVLSGNNAVVGPVIARNATANSDLQVNGSNIRVSQEAYLPNGVQTVVSQIRSVASAGTTTLPFPTGAQIERITISGNTGCTNLNDAAAWIGKIVVLVFSGTPTWTDGGNLKLSANFVATADDTLTLTSDGTNWFEIARSAN